MVNWEYLWVVIQREYEFEGGGLFSGGSSFKLSDWRIELPNKIRIQGSEKITEYLNQLGAQGWEQVSSTGEQFSELNWMKAMHLFFKRPKQYSGM